MNDLFKSMNKCKDNIFIKNDNGESITYKVALDYSTKIKELIPNRCFVFLLTKNTIGGVLNYVACLKNKIVPCLLSSGTSKDLVDHLIDIYKPKYIFVPNELVNTYNDYKCIYTEYDYSILKTNCEEVELYDDLCMLVSTSGSTGSEKLVRLSYKNVISNTEAGWNFFYNKLQKEGIEIDNKNFKSLVALPINYSFMLLVINITILGGGMLLVTEKSFVKKEFWDFFFKEGSTTLYGIPYHCEVLNKIGFFDSKAPFFKHMIIAGGNLSEELYKKCVKFSKDNECAFGVGYGQTEATAVISELYSENIEKRESIGKGLPGIELFIEDDDNSVINEPNILGELVCKGDNVALGYAKDFLDLSKGDEFGGILHTGDIALFDEDGYFYIKGRKKRFVKIYGSRVSLDDIESMIKNEFKVDVACIGKDDNIIVLVNDKSVLKNVEFFIFNRFDFNKKVISFRYVESILRNESGKILYSKLMSMYE